MRKDNKSQAEIARYIGVSQATVSKELRRNANSEGRYSPGTAQMFADMMKERSWSFSGLATMVRIVLMYYLNMQTFFNRPDADLKIMLAQASESPPGEVEKE